MIFIRFHYCILASAKIWDSLILNGNRLSLRPVLHIVSLQANLISASKSIKDILFISVTLYYCEADIVPLFILPSPLSLNFTKDINFSS